MLNKFIIILICIFLSTPVFSQTIKKVDIYGNKRISKNTILVLGDINFNRNYNQEKLNDTLKRLYNSNFFKDIQISLDGDLMIINVVENSIIERINIDGIKSEKQKEIFLDSMVLKERMSFSENTLKKDINLIKNILKSNGFYFAKIKTSINEDSNLNSVILNIEIDQGVKAKIKKIRFIGDKKIKDKKLLEVLASEEHKFWKFISNKVYLNQNTINLDKRLLENFYKNLGFYNVKVIDTFATYTNTGNFELIYNIDAGKRYYFNELKLILPEDYDLNDFNKINEIFLKLKNKRYSINDLNKILNEIDKIASQKLYDFIDADVTEKIVENDKINFEFKIVDSKKFYVEKIDIFGNYTTEEEVIRNKLIVDEGDPFNKLLFNKSINNIKSLRIFKNVKSEIIDGSEENLKNIQIDVEEQPTGEISLAAGLGTSGSTIGGGLTEKNFLGKGINFTTNLQISEDTVEGAFLYSRPNFAYTDNTLSTSLKAVSKDYLTDFGYETKETGFTIGTKFEQYENLFFSPEISMMLEDLKTNSNASSQLKKQKGKYTDLYFNYGLSYDLRDSTYNPSSGYNLNFYQNLPALSENNEVTNTLSITTYKKFFQESEMVGKTSFYLKTVNSIGNEDVRISKRAKIPYNRLRGFENGKVGPVDNGDYIGGNYVSSVNFSTNLPGILSTVENIDFSYFVDFANVWGVDYDSKIDGSNSIRSSTGLGANLLTPVGPLSFSISQPLTKKSSDKTETFRFNLGTTF